MVFTGEGNYVNCSDKTPKVIWPKDQGFDEAAEKIVNITSDNSNNGLKNYYVNNNYHYFSDCVHHSINHNLLFQLQ
jgi:hypothetical protein